MKPNLIGKWFNIELRCLLMMLWSCAYCLCFRPPLWSCQHWGNSCRQWSRRGTHCRHESPSSDQLYKPLSMPTRFNDAPSTNNALHFLHDFRWPNVLWSFSTAGTTPQIRNIILWMWNDRMSILGWSSYEHRCICSGAVAPTNKHSLKTEQVRANNYWWRHSQLVTR